MCKNFTLVGSEVLEEQVDVLNAVGSDNLSVNLLFTANDSLADARNEYEVAWVVLKLGLGSDSERNDTPVDAVAAIALGCILVADVGVATKHLLARSSLLTCTTITRTVSKYARTKRSVLGLSTYLSESCSNILGNIASATLEVLCLDALAERDERERTQRASMG